MQRKIFSNDKMEKLETCLEDVGRTATPEGVKFYVRKIIDEFAINHAGEAFINPIARVYAVEVIANELNYLREETDIKFDRDYNVSIEVDRQSLAQKTDRYEDVALILNKIVLAYGEAPNNALCEIVSETNKMQDEPDIIFQYKYRLLYEQFAEKKD
ncbi:MAG: hypothetical protein ABIF40_05445 [archaeon]